LPALLFFQILTLPKLKLLSSVGVNPWHLACLWSCSPGLAEASAVGARWWPSCLRILCTAEAAEICKGWNSTAVPGNLQV